jgi:hypothetical protein
MIQIKRFIDRVATMEGKQGRDVILPLADARALRDEIAKLVLDRYTDTSSPQKDEIIQVEVKGSKW